MDIPKIELHCHLDGSVSETAIIDIAKKSNVLVPEQIGNQIKAPKICNDLSEYLTCFNYILPFLQTKESLEIAAYDVIQQTHKDNIIYTEIRFAPQLHCKNGLEQIEVINAVLKGLKRGERDFKVKNQAILCMMRGHDNKENIKTLQCAKNLLGTGVCAVDLAGNEMAYPPELYKLLFEQAVKWEIPFTIHAGECGNANNVKTAIEMGAKRIGHGVAIAGNEEIKKLCKQYNVYLEMCPVSNIQTKAISDIKNYPFVKMQKEGVKVSINTDNRSVSDTNLIREWEILKESFSEIDDEIIKISMLHAIDGAFLSVPEKEKLKVCYT